MHETGAGSNESIVPIIVGPLQALFSGVFGLCFFLVILASVVLTAIGWCLIFKKAGWRWALGLLMLIPIVNPILFLILAFSEWPVRRELRAARLESSGVSVRS